MLIYSIFIVLLITVLFFCSDFCLMMYLFSLFFFFNQKPSYEVRFSDWSSDVCSSDLLVAVEAGRGDDAAAHRVDQAEHFLIVRKGVFADAIALERLGRRTAALVERGDEPLTRFDLVEHGGIGGGHKISGCLHTYVAARIAVPRAGCNGSENSMLSARRRQATACLPSIRGRPRPRSRRR